MPIEMIDQTARFTGICSIEEAEGFVAWLQATPQGEVDLQGCEHLHTALLQAILALHPAIAAAPADPFLRQWIFPLLSSSRTG